MDTWVGKKLPNLDLQSSDGRSVNFPEDLLGKWTVIYFYPKDDTPGCTKQACSYRDGLAEFRNLGVQIMGVSGDDLDSHGAFIRKFELNFPLLADTHHRLSGALGVYGEQEWQGKVFKGLSRDTFLVDPSGQIREVWRKVSPASTAQETLEAVRRHLIKAS